MNYQDYEKMIHKLANSHSSNLTEKEELTEVGQLAFVKATKIYDESKGAFSTLLWRTASCAMIDHLRKENRHKNLDSYEQLHEHPVYGDSNYGYTSPKLPVRFATDPSKIFELSETMSQLSKESQAVLRVVFDSHEEIFQETKSLAPKYLRGALTRILRKKNFTWKHITDSMEEIKNTVVPILTFNIP